MPGGAAGVVADRLSPTGAQVGDAALIPAQGVGNYNDRNSGAPPADAPLAVPSAGRPFRLPTPAGGALLQIAPQHRAAETGPQIWTGRASIAGAPEFVNVIEEHGPLVDPARTGPFAWWPFRKKRVTALGHEENVLPAMGGDEIAGVAEPSYAAVSRDNAFRVVDQRRVDAPQDSPNWEGRAGAISPPKNQEPEPYTVHSETEAPELNTYTDYSPDRPRAGAAEAWQGRPAGLPQVYWFTRPGFDQWAAHHTPGTKGVQGQPRVSLPISTQREVATTGVAGSHVSTPAPGMEPLGLSPNTFRLTPQPWDQDLVNTGVTASPYDSGQIGVAASANAARRGFALR